MSLFFEDFEVGRTQEAGSRTVTREEILEFARKFDPQPFHVDEEAARRSPFGGLIASGWHTAALCHGLLVEQFLGSDSGSMGSPGVDELRWLKPVRPGDTLTVRTEVVAVTPSRSKPGGLVKLRYVMRNQNGEEVMTMIANGFFRRRGESRR
ncbi:MAG TPA: MaoC family dehydratase [Thermoanaerobaculia bacterium]|jgi:acyl dehydratase|nr:MaoC family dehydratase [Thermoanaerobaculia bacterium]